MNQLLFIINLFFISSLAIPQSVFETVAILQEIAATGRNTISDKFIVFFDPVCVAAKEANGIDIIDDFTALFTPCYTTSQTITDEYPDIVNHWIYMEKSSNCIQNDGITIEYTDYCLIIAETDHTFERLATNQCVSRTVEAALWNLDRVSPPDDDKYTYIKYASTYDPNMDIIIMDSGVDFNHVQFNGITKQLLYTAYPGQNLDDHGTHVAGTAVGETYGAFRAKNSKIKLIDVRIFPESGGASNTDVLNGFDAIIDYLTTTGRKAIINMSFGGFGGDLCGILPFSSQDEERLAAITAAGGISFAAAGNEMIDASCSTPASSVNTITVGAHGTNNNRASFSNYNIPLIGPDDVDIWAPGDNIKSSVPGGANNDASDFLSGTSMASPLVAGIAANILANNPSFTFADIKNELLANAINDVGDGLLNLNIPKWPRVQSTCDQYCNHANPDSECSEPPPPATALSGGINLDIPGMITDDHEYYNDDNYYNHDNDKEDYNYNYNYDPEINYKPGVESKGMSQYMVQGFVITLLMILICFIVLYCNQKGDNEINKGYNSFKMVEI